MRWLHTGGIFAALASNTAEAVLEAVEAAQKFGTIVAYDLNYRPRCGRARAARKRPIESIAESRGSWTS